VRRRAETHRIATGDRKLVRFSARALDALRSRDLGAVRSLLERGIPGTTVRVSADPRRRELPAADVVARLRRSSGGPDRGGPLLDYTFDLGRQVRGIVLEAVNRGGGARRDLLPATAQCRRG